MRDDARSNMERGQEDSHLTKYYFELEREYTGLSGQDLRQIKSGQTDLKCFC